MRYLLVLLLLSYCSAPHWALPDDTCQWGTTWEVIQSRDSGAFVIWLLPLGTLSCLFVCFLFGNVFLVDWASWISLLSMRVELSPTILVEETFMISMALVCNFMETVYRPWGNRLRIHQILGSLKLIWVAKTSNLFLITFFHVKFLLLSSLDPQEPPLGRGLSKDEMIRQLWGTDLEWKVFGRGSYRDGGGRSVKGGHISQRIKGTEGMS